MIRVGTLQEAFRTVDRLADGLTVLWGTGYPVDTPHAVAVRWPFHIDLTVYPQGDNGLTGIGRGRECAHYRIELIP